MLPSIVTAVVTHSASWRKESRVEWLLLIQLSKRSWYFLSIASLNGHILKWPCNSPPAMESKAGPGLTSDASSHKRTKSSVLKSIIPGNYKRQPSSKSNDQSYWNDDYDRKKDRTYLGNQSILPPDHPHTRLLREDHGNRNTISASLQKSADARKENKSMLEENQKMTRSASFKSLVGKEKDKSSKKKLEDDEKMKKSKSSTSISAMLLRPRSSRGVKAEETHRLKDKENQAPPSSAGMAPPPIWAQFATQGFEAPLRTTKIPLNDQGAVEEEATLHTRRDYSPLKQRNFQDYQQPTLSRRAELKPRPNSECTPSGPTSASFAETVSGLRKHGQDKSHVDISHQQRYTGWATDMSQKMNAEENHLSERPSTMENRKVSNDSAGSDLPVPKRGSRVMAAVAAFNSKSKDLPKEPLDDTRIVQLDPKAIERAFESLLVS